eukprot:TRINITY_DN311_c0_g1_i1.p2 TRINITY_DN311_c0_g1~~TRINITY_DN311_c0_g1_i1.p2  ORF type:complete len:798 (-),score=275.14 TRINITY_DN311_c0_g1_i1:120-2513(-)
MRIKKVLNVGVALKFVESKGVKLVGIGAEEIVDHNLKMILGMIWTLILRFQIQDISEEELSAKEALLLWYQKKTKGYKNVNVQDFHRSFQDGLAWCAVIHKHRPDLIDFDSLNPSDSMGNLKLAFEIADKHLDVPQILDPADIVDTAKPDERSIITYCSALYHVFAKGQQAEQAAKNLANALDIQMQIAALKDEYARRAKALLEWTHAASASLAERNFPNSVEGVQTKISEFKAWKKDEKAPKGNEKTEVEALFNNIQTKLRLNKRAAYVPPAGLHPSDIDSAWSSLGKAENDRGVALRQELRRQRYLASLVASFKLQAGSLSNWVAVKTKLLQSDTLGNTVDSVNAALRNLEAFHEDYSAQSSKLTVLADLSNKLAEGKSADADSVASELSSLQSSWDSLKPMYESRKAALEAQLEKLQAIQAMLVDFAKKALAFARFAEDSTQTLGEPVLVDSIEELAALETRLAEIADSVAQRQGDVADLESLASKLHDAGVEETTYSEYSIGDIKQHHSTVDAAVAERKKVLAAEHAKQLQNEELRKKWASEAAAFSEWCNGREAAIKDRSANPGSSEVELKATLTNIEAFRAELHSNQSKFDAISHLAQQLEDAEITENKHSTLTFENLKLQWDALFALQANSQKIIENEILLKAHSGVTDEQLAEFKSAFAHFDKDNSGHLNRLEFKSCLQSLGEELKDPEIEALMNEYGLLIEENGATTRQLPFNSFVAYMIKKHSNTDNAQAIVESFATIAGGKEFVTANDLRSVLPNDKVDYLLAHMPKHASVEDGYDYKSYAATLYA